MLIGLRSTFDYSRVIHLAPLPLWPNNNHDSGVHVYMHTCTSQLDPPRRSRARLGIIAPRHARAPSAFVLFFRGFRFCLIPDFSDFFLDCIQAYQLALKMSAKIITVIIINIRIFIQYNNTINNTTCY